jgi:hypothetical protein
MEEERVSDWPKKITVFILEKFKLIQFDLILREFFYDHTPGEKSKITNQCQKKNTLMWLSVSLYKL